jgi:CubicO group peptidase (beta-lactamase class C family)
MVDEAQAVDRLATDAGFSGVIRIDRDDEVVLGKAYGFADRAHRVANTVDTRFGIASGVKGLTALTVMRLVDGGRLQLDAPVRSLLGDDLSLVDDHVTVEHLLAHRSGIGDYVDEEGDLVVTEHVLPVPVHELTTTEAYLGVLDGHPQKFGPGERFSYCNSGYVVLALVAERATGTPFEELVSRYVCVPAGMHRTAFLRSDALPGDAAIGYLWADRPTTNVFHLPVCGSGDGGIYSTAGDLHALWAALFTGRILPEERVAEMLRPRSEVPEDSKRYGLGFWLHESEDAVILEGYDAGVSFRSLHHPGRRLTHTVISNTSDGAWPVTRRIDELLLA